MKESVSPVVPNESSVVPHHENFNLPEIMNYAPAPQNPLSSTVSSGLRNSKAVIVLGILLLVSFAIIAFQSVSHSKQCIAYEQQCADYEANIVTIQAEVEKLENTISNNESTIADLNQKYASLEDENSELGYKADIYDYIVSSLKYGQLGYASKTFNMNHGIIVAPLGSAHKTIKLYAKFNKSVTIMTDYAGNSAELEFSKDSWYGPTTTLTVIPRRAGVTIVTFSNSVTKETFDVLVIVPD